jgi:hypothetical protein
MTTAFDPDTATIFATTANVEQEIRYIANRIVAAHITRVRKPTHAPGKTEIRRDAAMLTGMVALYGYITGQIPSVTADASGVTFTDPLTGDRVTDALIGTANL